METYKQEFIDFMVESDVLKFGDFTLKSGRMQRQSMTTMETISTCFSDRHIRESRLQLSQRSHTVNYMEKKSVTAQTEKKQKTTELTRAVSSEAA